MPNNYILLETIALTQTAASVTFDNLPTSGYTDLKVVVSARSTANGGQNMNLTFNSTTSGYSDKILSGNGSAAASFSSGNTSRGGSCVMPGADFTANTFGNGEIYIPNYRGSNAKSFSSDSVSENNATLSYNQMQATLWNNSAAITNILIDLSGGSFAANSTFSLYGIAALGTTPVLAPKATGGNIVANDGTYWYHAFTSSGNFVPQVGLTADVLVVAGGGAGGGYFGGGGGAGGLLAHTSQSLANGTNYACTVGAGGVGVNSANGGNGSNSQFAALTASAGGGGGGGYTLAGVAGGSGGGAGNDSSPAKNGGAATPSGQGNAGGKNYNAVSAGFGGGGGGAGAVGADGIITKGGNGGAGSSAYSSWGLATNTGQNVSGTVWYAGGGGGDRNGVGGNGGGGNGAPTSSGAGTAGTANTGGGGGDNLVTNIGMSGGSGIILIRYPVN